MPDTADTATGTGTGEPGLVTFLGRVRGRLDPADQAWVESTSHAMEDLRERLIDAADRLGHLQQRCPDDAGDHTGGESGTGSAGDPVADLTAWERMVAWAASVNGSLVEAAGRRRTPTSFDTAATAAIAAEQAARAVPERIVELGALLQSVRGEQVIDELLAAGLLVAPPGTTGSIAFAEHGAWDIEFLGSGGHTIARADVAITSDAPGVLEHLAARPGVDVVYVASDAADDLATGGGVTVLRPGDAWPAGADGVVAVDVGADTGALHAELTEVLDSVGSESSADALLEAVPVLALLLVGSRAAARAATTVDDGSDIATATWQQTKDVITTAGVSELVGWASGMNLIKVPATLTFALGRAAVRDARASVELSGRRAVRARRLISGIAGAG